LLKGGSLIRNFVPTSAFHSLQGEIPRKIVGTFENSFDQMAFWMFAAAIPSTARNKESR
jgi:hypothetical protein